MISDLFSESRLTPARTRFTDSTAKAANTAIQIFAPASNVNGAIIEYAVIAGYSASIEVISLAAGTVAPATQGAAHAIIAAYAAPNTYAIAILPKQVYLPPGVGLWLISLTAETASFNAVGYTLL